MRHMTAVITVVYENYTVLPDLLESLRNQSYSDFKVYIADLSEHKQPISIEGLTSTVLLEKNLGYAHGVNAGIRQAVSDGATQFIVINNDTRLAKDFVEQCVLSLQKNPRSIIGGKIYYEKGYEYHKDRYSQKDLGNVLWYAGGIMDWNHVITKHRGVDEVDHEQYDSPVKTEFVTGCLMCYDQEVLHAIGQWDTSYFLYYEDADFCVRASRRGVQLLYNPFIVMWHKNAQSSEGSGSSLHVSYQEKNRVKFGLKYAPFRTKLHLVKNYFLRLIRK